MKYFVLLAGPGGTKPWDQMTAEEQEADLQRHHAFGQACEEREGVEIVSSEALDESAPTTMRTSADGEVVLTDGPFAEAAEGIGGYYVIDAPDLDVLVELLKVMPPYDMEIRPVLDMSGA